MGLIAEGKTNRRIAEELGHSEATVKLQVQRILAKLGAKRRARAAKRAVVIGLLPPSRRAVKPAPTSNRGKKMQNG